MLTPTEIKAKAERKYPDFLRSLVQEEPFFPLEIKFGRPSPTADYSSLRDAVQALLASAKAERGLGYTVESEPRQTHKHGWQTLPTRVYFASEADYLRLLGKQKEAQLFMAAVARTLAQFPTLHQWLAQYPKRLIENLTNWDDILLVCAYFVANPRPQCYARELPIPVHTKFVEQNEGILRQLLDVLLPETAVDTTTTIFSARFGLRQPEPLFRLRLLDENLRGRLGWPSTDLALPLPDLAALNLADFSLFIIENQLTFLTFPPMAHSIALWGQGYQAIRLAAVPWLAETHITYWGDMDAQGFEILAGLRTHFAHVQSFLMDTTTWAQFAQFIVPGKPSTMLQAPRLTTAETAVYTNVVHNNLRLEQERIPHVYLLAQLGLVPLVKE